MDATNSPLAVQLFFFLTFTECETFTQNKTKKSKTSERIREGQW